MSNCGAAAMAPNRSTDAFRGCGSNGGHDRRADTAVFSATLEQIPSEPKRFATTYLRKNKEIGHFT